MGTVLRESSGLGVVVQTGGHTAFGTIALRLGERQPQTAFQLVLRAFSLLLVRVTALLAGSILAINIALGRSVLISMLFALAIAVGLTPQLLPAIVTVSLSTGANTWELRMPPAEIGVTLQPSIRRGRKSVRLIELADLHRPPGWLSPSCLLRESRREAS